MTNSFRTTLTTLAAITLMGSSAAYADHDRRSNDTSELLLGVASAFLIGEAIQHVALDRPSRSRHGRAHRYGRDDSARDFGSRGPNRIGFSGSSYTSEPVRGGSS